MYIDSGRVKDLQKLDRQLYDKKAPEQVRERAYRMRQKLIGQLRDKKLAMMRERLIKAGASNDRREMWKITCQIKDYLGEEIPHDIYEGKV